MADNQYKFIIMFIRHKIEAQKICLVLHGTLCS